MDLRLRFQPKQLEVDTLVESSQASWLGYGGSKGGAKSGYIRRGMLRRRYDYPGTTGQILRRVWDDVDKNHVTPFFEEFPELRKHYQSTKHVIEIPVGRKTSRIYFDSAENKSDVERKAMGPEFMDIFVDQAEQFTEYELKRLKSTCRWPNTPDYRCKFGLFFNPGGIGAAFLRRVFYTKEYHERESKADFAFVQAYGWDNVEWCRDALREDGLTERDFYQMAEQDRFKYFVTRSQYGKQLDAMDESDRKAYLLGEFGSFAGQYFANFDKDRHTILPHEVKLERWWPKWMSGDWGFQHPAAFYWHTRRDDGVIVTYREEYARHIGETEWGSRLAKVAALHPEEKIQLFALSPDAFAKKGENNTPAEQIGSEIRRYGIPYPMQADTDRKGGARLMHQMLQTDSWLISTACPHLIDTLPVLVHDEEPRHEDVLKIDATESTDGDDAYDGARYGLKTFLKPGTIPDETKIERVVREFANQRNTTVEEMDINTVAMISRRTRADLVRSARRRRGGLGRVFRPQPTGGMN